jgi:hypothetical protein
VAVDMAECRLDFQTMHHRQRSGARPDHPITGHELTAMHGPDRLYLIRNPWPWGKPHEATQVDSNHLLATALRWVDVS